MFNKGPVLGFLKLAAVLIVVVCVVNADQLWHLIQKTPYALEYNVSEANVTILPRPADCDFFASPIGFKSCHYEKEVAVFDNLGRGIVGGYVINRYAGERLARGQASSVTVGWHRIE
jgi:hypothetical protein